MYLSYNVSQNHIAYAFLHLLQTNKTVENIGARRLHTIIERVVEDISFEAPEKEGEKITVDAAYVKQKVGEILKSQDMRKYIL